MLVNSLWARTTFFTLTLLYFVLDAWTQAATFEQARKAEPHNIGEIACACCAGERTTLRVRCCSVVLPWRLYHAARGILSCVDAVLWIHALCFIAFACTACCARLAERVTKFLCTIPSEDFFSFGSDRVQVANSFCFV